MDGGRIRMLGETSEVLDAYEAAAMSRKLESARQMALAKPRIEIPTEHRALWLARTGSGEDGGHVLGWDVADYNVAYVRFTVTGPTGDERTIGTGQGRGSKLLGPWLAPGMILRLRDNLDGAVLGELVVGD